MIIGEVIKKARIARNITQEELATALHITPQAVSRWENGLSCPDTPMLPQIAGEAVKRALALGANGFVAKPFAPHSILERIG